MKRILLIIITLILFISCKSTSHVASADSSRSAVRVETHYIRDSIYIDRNHVVTVRGDTVYTRDSIYLHSFLLRRDTVRDTLRQVVNKTDKQIVTHERKVYPIWPYIAFIGVFFLIYIWRKLSR